ncbi:MAG: 50S ribosomal protein L18 [Candidatus Yanofskybacteria bacterium]|nr:50S ribosomal protein L18 [Candidatus Yanofskybacteria bacterium]
MNKKQHREKRHNRVRAKVRGTKETPRVSVFRSSRHVFVQIIDDATGKTLISASDILKVKNSMKSGTKIKKESKTARADLIGETLAKKAKDMRISKVVFDRGGYKYHGRIRALAEGLRRGGLKF